MVNQGKQSIPLEVETHNLLLTFVTHNIIYPQTEYY